MPDEKDERPKKKKSLVDAFLFRKAKEAVDRVCPPVDSPAGRSHHTTHQTSDHTIDHTINQTIDHSIDQRIDQTIDHSIDQSTTGLTPRLATQLTKKRSINPTIDPGINPEISPSIDHSINQTIDHSIDQRIDQKVFQLGENEALLYYVLLLNEGCFTTARRISQKLGKSEHTIRKCLRRLKKKGLIEYREEFLRNQRGVRIVEVKEAEVVILKNEEKVLEKLEKLPITEISMDRGQLTRRLTRQLTRQLTTQLTRGLTTQLTTSDPISSSSFLNKPTTTNSSEAEGGDAAEEIFRASFMTYWKDKGLTPKQVAGWIEECAMTAEEMLQSLEHCWYEMVHLGKEQKKGIKDVCSYFYTVIRKNGFYPRPEGFKTVEELRAEQMERARKEREKALEKLKEEIRRDWKLKREEKFYQILSDPTCEEYRRCFKELSAFERKLDRGSPAFERAMRRAFEKLFPDEEKE